MALTEANVAYLEDQIVALIDEQSYNRFLTATSVWAELEFRMAPGYAPYETSEAAKQGISLGDLMNFREPEVLWRLAAAGRIVRVVTTRPNKAPEALYFPKGTTVSLEEENAALRQELFELKNDIFEAFGQLAVNSSILPARYSVIAGLADRLAHDAEFCKARELNVAPTPSRNMPLEDIVRHYSERVQNGRTVQDAFNHMWSEAHELDAEVARFMAGDAMGEDGIKGEGMDVISCVLDVIYLAHPGITNKQMREIMVRKMEKWLTLYGSSTK